MPATPSKESQQAYSQAHPAALPLTDGGPTLSHQPWSNLSSNASCSTELMEPAQPAGGCPCKPFSFDTECSPHSMHSETEHVAFTEACEEVELVDGQLPSARQGSDQSSSKGAHPSKGAAVTQQHCEAQEDGESLDHNTPEEASVPEQVKPLLKEMLSNLQTGTYILIQSI